MKTNVYVDGFNLYYGALRHTSYKWLDLAALCSQILDKKHAIHRIRYFTAHVHNRPNSPGKALRQQAYLRALRTIPNLTVHLGRYLENDKWMPYAHPPATGPMTVLVRHNEEKGSDVNIATFMLLDAFDADCEAEVLISNDSDLCSPVKAVRVKFGLTMGIINPHKKPSWPLKKVGTFYRPIHIGALQLSQFPVTMQDRNGTITKPATW